MSQSPDLCIVGAGALGIALALYARRLGASVVLVGREGEETGGEAQSDLRLSALSASASVAETLRRAAGMGLGPEPRKLALKAVSERVDRVVAQQSVEQDHSILAARGIQRLEGPVQFANPRSIQVGDTVVKPRYTVLAPGSIPRLPVIEGLDRVAYFTPHSIVENTRKLTHLVVIGGGEAAVEMAQIQRRLGAEITLVTQGEPLPGYDREGVDILLPGLQSEGVRILSDCHVSKIIPRAQGTGVLVSTAQGEVEALDVSHILVALGHSADWRDLDLAKARLRPAKGNPAGLVHGPLGQTSNRAVRLVGAAAGIEQWAEALAHGRAVIEALVHGGNGTSPIAPRLVRTDPALAQVGSIAQGGNRSGRQVLRANLGENGLMASRGRDRGLVKVLAEKRDHIVGAVIVAPDAGEIAGLVALAMHRRIGLRGLSAMPAPRPSLSAALQELAEEALPSRAPSLQLKLHRAWRSLVAR
ncbi:FAD-dependent oxidoreductase [Devosia sp. FJ2-5-3]|uniref:FAD-dependent oxidoreductase n=1 Tax=Devosia sp. FJ2-5-3 TaxID=2976680 RepID=UPI0023D81011|nr:FAD-dependent oxidoreductase [Devosia sp. FJ2-5-3]WEJ59195.1 FAD-dependent oxidoreductase [Devosia sp. FJ2-5-3]